MSRVCRVDRHGTQVAVWRELSCRVLCGRVGRWGVEWKDGHASLVFSRHSGEERMESKGWRVRSRRVSQRRVSCVSRRVCRAKKKEKGLRATKDQSILPTHTSRSLKHRALQLAHVTCVWRNEPTPSTPPSLSPILSSVFYLTRATPSAPDPASRSRPCASAPCPALPCRPRAA